MTIGGAVSGTFTLYTKFLCVFVSSKVPMELVWPAGKVGPRGVCGWARCSSGQLPGRAGIQRPPIPISHSSCARCSSEGLAGPGILKENLLEAGGCACALGAAAPTATRGLSATSGFGWGTRLGSGTGNPPLIAGAAPLPFSYCLLAGGVHSTG